MKRFWFRFEHEPHNSGYKGSEYGVTAYDYRDALNLLKDNVFLDDHIPPIIQIIENVDVSTLDAGHVLPNMYSPNLRGIWYPIGFTINN